MSTHLIFTDLGRSGTFFIAFLYFFIYPTSQYSLCTLMTSIYMWP